MFSVLIVRKPQRLAHKEDLSMQDLPHPWGAYAHLQAHSSRNSTINSRSWGIEEEMNLFLGDPSAYISVETRRLEGFRATVARRERSRASLRKLHEAELAPTPRDPVFQLEAREALAIIEADVSAAQWTLMMDVAEGLDYADISMKQAISVGAARAQMCRLRQHFSHLRPAA
jgi:hypothetical protein